MFYVSCHMRYFSAAFVTVLLLVSNRDNHEMILHGMCECIHDWCRIPPMSVVTRLLLSHKATFHIWNCLITKTTSLMHYDRVKQWQMSLRSFMPFILHLDIYLCFCLSHLDSKWESKAFSNPFINWKQRKCCVNFLKGNFHCNLQLSGYLKVS